MMQAREEWRHFALLLALLVLFVVTPMLTLFRHGALIMNIVAAAALAIATYALSERKRLFAAAVVLCVISVIATWLLLITQKTWAAIFSHSCVIVLIIFLSVTILAYVLHGSKITMDKIFAAICVYLLLGYAWTFAYALVEDLVPGSFGVLAKSAPNEYVARVLQMRYFSFMTLTTVGYGDITPRSSAARTLAALEAVTGQIYLTVLIARLVGLHIVHAQINSRRDR